MADTIANAVVEIARLAVMAYGIHYGGRVCLLWVERSTLAQSREQIIDAARREGIEVTA